MKNWVLIVLVLISLAFVIGVSGCTQEPTTSPTTEKNLNLTTFDPPAIYIAMGLNYCSAIDVGAQQQGVSASTLKKSICSPLCDQNALEYYDYNCDDDKFKCLCKSVVQNASQTECPKEILPDKIVLTSPVTIQGWAEQLLTTWKDGTPISNPYFTAKECWAGKEAGQNVNYFYCEPIPYIPKDTFVDEQGNIIKKNVTNYSVSLVLKLIEGEIWATMDTEIFGNYSIVNATCTKI